MENTRIELSQLYEEQQGELERRCLEEQEAMLASLREELARETTRADTAEERTEEIAQRVEDLKVELQRAREDGIAVRNELSSARQAHQAELDRPRRWQTLRLKG